MDDVQDYLLDLHDKGKKQSCSYVNLEVKYAEKKRNDLSAGIATIISQFLLVVQSIKYSKISH